MRRFPALVALALAVACTSDATTSGDPSRPLESTEPPPFNIYNGDWWFHDNTVAAALDEARDAVPPEDPTWAERIENLANIPIQEQYRLALEACEANNGGRVHFDGRVLDCMPDGEGGFTLKDLSR